MKTNKERKKQLAILPGVCVECVDDMDLLRLRFRVMLLRDMDNLRMRFLILSMMVTAPLTSSSVT